MNELPLRFAEDPLPIVRKSKRRGSTTWLFGAGLLVAAVLLFLTLNARRQRTETSLEAEPRAQTITAPPPLALPSYPGSAYPEAWPVFRRVRLAPAPMMQAPGYAAPRRSAAAPAFPRPAPSPIYQGSAAAPVASPYLATPQAPAFSEMPRLGAAPEPQIAAAAGAGNERVVATRLANPSLTVPKGSVITAVLETALDSTRAGAARALVQRDVMGFDGTRVLIGRGSRLYGEYTSEVSPGQKRALIKWKQLTRPDGVTINLDSPSADPLGRSGVEGRVDNHLVARLGSALVQTVLNLGAVVATRSVANDPFVVALPGTAQQAVTQQPSSFQPTLRIRQGTSVSVFVARDLDFASVER